MTGSFAGAEARERFRDWTVPFTTQRVWFFPGVLDTKMTHAGSRDRLVLQGMCSSCWQGLFQRPKIDNGIEEQRTS
jgi:hypothetical protein